MPSVISESVFRPLIFEPEQPTEADLEAMGFDVRHLGFYVWLVRHGIEPTMDGDTRPSVSRFGHLAVS